MSQELYELMRTAVYAIVDRIKELERQNSELAHQLEQIQRERIAQ